MTSRSAPPGLFPLAIFMTAIVAAVGIPGQPIGINLALTSILVLASVAIGLRNDLERFDLLLLSSAAALAGFSVFRTASWLLALDLLTAFGLAALAAGGTRSWSSLVQWAFRLPTLLHRGLWFALTVLLSGLPRHGLLTLRPVLRGALWGSALLVVFGSLFLTADPAFASLAGDYLVPQWDIALVPARLAVAAICLTLVGSLILLSPVVQSGFGDSALAGRRLNFELQPAEWKTALAILNLLFVAFVVVQISVLFGGHMHVLETTGLTYSEYARQGFFQLIVVACLTLGLIAASVRFGRVEAGDLLWMKCLLGVLCASTFVILASALTRMNLYQEAYGFTRLRLLVDTTVFWLGGMFLLLLVAGALWNGRWLPRGVIVLSFTTLLALNLYNPDARIAERNVERYEATGRLDTSYLSSLSADALPYVLRLPEPHRSCIAASIAVDVDDSSSVWGLNFARRRAAELIRAADLPSPTGEMACSY